MALIGSLGSPLFLYSGANDMTEAILRRQPHVQNHSHNTTSGYWRDDTRDAPSNLYTDTGPHWAGAEGDAPPPQFAYRVDGASVSGTPADGFAVTIRRQTRRGSGTVGSGFDLSEVNVTRWSVASQ